MPSIQTGPLGVMPISAVPASTPAPSSDEQQQADGHDPVSRNARHRRAGSGRGRPHIPAVLPSADMIRSYPEMISFSPSTMSSSSSTETCPMRLPILSRASVLTWLILTHAFRAWTLSFNP